MSRKNLINLVASLCLAWTAWFDVGAAAAWPTQTAQANTWSCSPWSASDWLTLRACQRATSAGGELVVEAHSENQELLEIRMRRCALTTRGPTYGINTYRRTILLGERETTTVARSVRWQPISLANVRVACDYDLRTSPLD